MNRRCDLFCNEGSAAKAWPVADFYRTLKTDAQRQQLEAEVKEVCKVVSGMELTENIIRSEYPLQ